MKWMLGLVATVTAGLLSPPAIAQNSDVLFREGFEDPCAGTVESLAVASPASWSALFSGVWPRPFAVTRNLTLPEGRIAALEFTASADFGGMIDTNEISGMLPGSNLVISISKCRADFRPEALVSAFQRCLVSAPQPQLQILWLNGQSNVNACRLDSGQTYWLNVGFLNLPAAGPQTGVCPNPTCTIGLTSRSLSRADQD